MLHEILANDRLWWLFHAGILLLLLLSVEAGYRLGRAQHKRAHPEQKAQAGTVLVAMLALLGFLIAVTFGLASDRFMSWNVAPPSSARFGRRPSQRHLTRPTRYSWGSTWLP